MSRNARTFWIAFVISVLVDQITKFLVYTHLPPGGGPAGTITVIPGFFDIIQAQNPGAAFSILRDFQYRYLVFLGFTIVAVLYVWTHFRTLKHNEWRMSLALGLIASGAVGNAIDRIHKRTVTDFLSVHFEQPGLKRLLINWFGTNEYPTFNIADSALLIGVFLFIAAEIWPLRDDTATGAPASPPSPPAA